MTDKQMQTDKEQIIIDGVDVRNCKGIDLSLSPLVKCKSLKFKTSDGGIAGIWCSDHTNCYFKQLARKTREYEQLQEKYEALKLENQEGYEIVAELKQECGVLKKERMTLTNKNNLLKAELNQVKLLLEGKNTQYNTLFKEIERLKREYGVLKQNTTITEKLSGDRYRKALYDIETQLSHGFTTTAFYKILDIINKAKGEGNGN